ncbi:DnaJ-class molecular chaperone [Pararhizobium capsulatum DSM 1112]|uniref:DnaJ-class molecular chaperone n=1 Tax=Pararhizobium capsulatum DSM 1112 TaxID=1121113 RepID=A0ABU0BMF4_9HYPH|nr:DnaJ C-terminal domain-containing protein [Pararhizobium capsulatum]MDQ0319428.1 DnaJ-class molecular chaperone [Pararhizobium capsulatum DSM 1112]
MRDPYTVLGVRRNAGADEIKTAWRNVAKAVHPDHNRDDPNAAARFAEAGRAYEVLKDPKLRNRYDYARREADLRRMEEMKRKSREQARDTVDPETAEEMISRIFGAETRPQAKPQPIPKAASVQPQAEVKADPKPETRIEPGVAAEPETAEQKPEAKPEVEKRYGPFGILPRAAAPAAELVSAIVRRIRGAQKPADKVPDIFSEATVTIADILRREKATATLPDGQTLKVALPPGTVDGSVIRLKEQGYRLNGMIRGDLIVHVRIAADETFRPNGIDLHTTLPINIQDAVLGCEMRVDTPTGATSITIPAWSGSDQAIRLEGHGLPDADGGRGALVVELRLMLWEKPDERITDLMRARRDGLVL